ncbi:MAG: AmmeMemoRadiSam system protein A [Propionibacteriaceae bacterium]|jgi:AmmeMemoRadiSam system protein A|nr:AmmeMemoRadiSam system protein A [Propionibacteriaceae bacterium]
MPNLPNDAGQVLTATARQAITERLRGYEVFRPGGEGPPPPADLDWLNERGASFVTLTIDGRLRGCIGSLEAWRWLGEDVRLNAVAAAFKDPRFLPLDPAELDHLHIVVSVLTAPQPLEFDSEAEALAQLRPGVDGVVLQAGHHRATFLPQVWEELPDKVEFMSHLKRKARLSPDYWGPDVELSVYQVEAFGE